MVLHSRTFHRLIASTAFLLKCRRGSGQDMPVASCMLHDACCTDKSAASQHDARYAVALSCDRVHHYSKVEPKAALCMQA